MAIKSIVYERRPTFEQAQKEAGVGYQNDVLLKDASRTPYDISAMAITDLPPFFGHSMAAIGLVALRQNLRKLRVLDIGGALGGHFTAAKTTFGESLGFEWTVVETTMFTTYARSHIITPEVKFTDSINDVAAQEFDLAYLSSVLPYVSDIQGLFSAKALRSAPYLFISRTGMHDTEIPFLQTVTYDTGVVRYPGRILSRPKLMEQLGQDYDLVTSWQYDQYSVEDRPYSAPSMLWRRKV